MASKNTIVLVTSLLFMLGFYGCETTIEGDADPILTLQQENELGDLLKSELETSGLEVLSPSSFPFVYSYIQNVKNELLTTGQFSATGYDYKIAIIKDTFTFEAFSLPGAYQYVSAGLLLNLNGEDELAAILAKEMGHLDKGDTKTRLVEFYGVPLILDIFSDTNSVNAPAFINLFRTDGFLADTEAKGDRYSVDALCDLPYATDALPRLYNRIRNDSLSSFLMNYDNNYPIDSTRVFSIVDYAATKSCTGLVDRAVAYAEFLDSVRVAF